MRTTTGSILKKLTALGTASALGFTSLVSFAPAARADEVASSPKGLIGGALLGGEVVSIGESLIGFHSGWAYLIGDVVGAGGGAVGGYFIDKGSSNGVGSMVMFAGGLALFIPAVVLTLNATRYQGSENATEDKPPVNAPEANPGTPGGSMVSPGAAPPPSPSPAPPPAAAPPSSLLDVRPGAIRIGMPVPEVRMMYSLREQQQYGLPQRTEVRMPVFAVSF